MVILNRILNSGSLTSSLSEGVQVHFSLLILTPPPVQWCQPCKTLSAWIIFFFAMSIHRLISRLFRVQTQSIVCCFSSSPVACASPYRHYWHSLSVCGWCAPMCCSSSSSASIRGSSTPHSPSGRGTPIGSHNMMLMTIIIINSSPSHTLLFRSDRRFVVKLQPRDSQSVVVVVVF